MATTIFDLSPFDHLEMVKGFNGNEKFTISKGEDDKFFCQTLRDVVCRIVA